MSTSQLPSCRSGVVAKWPALVLAAWLQLGNLAQPVAAHSFVSSIQINGLAYSGFRPLPPAESDPNTKSVGWVTTAYDQGYVNQTGFNVPASVFATDNSTTIDEAEDDLEIICHRGSYSTAYHAPVEAGGQIHVQWNGWPVSHKGPVMSYLAFCGDSSALNVTTTPHNDTENLTTMAKPRGCNDVQKRDLSFFKIEQHGLIDTSIPADSETTSTRATDLADMTWASDLLIANNNSWVVSLPERLRPGFYVLRHEIIALHNASHPDGAQNYPQCLNLEITAPGVSAAAAAAGGVEQGGYILPSGVWGGDLYNATGRDKASFDVNIYAPVAGGEGGRGGKGGKSAAPTYPIPGPGVAVWGKNVTLSHPVPTAAGTPVVA